MGNKGAFIRFEAPDLKPNIITFSAVVSGFYFSNNYNVFYFYISIYFYHTFFSSQRGGGVFYFQ